MCSTRNASTARPPTHAALDELERYGDGLARPRDGADELVALIELRARAASALH
jgi:hypothetical protein